MKNEINLSEARVELIRLTSVLEQCSSHMQAEPYENRLREICNSLLARGDDSDIRSATAYFQKLDPDGYAYDKLSTIAEDCAESVEDEEGAALLLLIPILAWSRYRNYYGVLDETTLADIADCVRENFATPRAHDDAGAHMISYDHLISSNLAVRDLVQLMRRQEHGSAVPLSGLMREAPPPDFADSRYILCCVAASKREDLFRGTDETLVDAARGMMNFCLKTHEILELTMLGSVFEVQPAGGYYRTWRDTEPVMRAWALTSLVDFTESMGFAAADLVATIGLFVPGPRDSNPMSELRISLSRKTDRDSVLCGISWGVLPSEIDAFTQTARDLLDSKRITDVVEHEQSFRLEWCEDCGAPLYATPSGLVVHNELPEDSGMPEVPTLN